MSHKHATILRSIFHDPLPANLQWREIESLLNNLGAQISPGHGARFKVMLNGIEGTLHHPHHGNTMSRQDLKVLRDYLGHAGISPSAYEAAGD